MRSPRRYSHHWQRTPSWRPYSETWKIPSTSKTSIFCKFEARVFQCRNLWICWDSRGTGSEDSFRRRPRTLHLCGTRSLCKPSPVRVFNRQHFTTLPRRRLNRRGPLLKVRLLPRVLTMCLRRPRTWMTFRIYREVIRPALQPSPNSRGNGKRKARRGTIHLATPSTPSIRESA